VPGPEPQPESDPVGAPAPLARAQSGPAFPNLGITLDGMDCFLATHGAAIGEDATTSDVCHTVLKVLTTPRGWICEATVTDPQKGWYRHRYVHAESGAAYECAPAGTCSYLQLMQRAPETAAFVGAPTVFLSHAWSYKFRDVIGALRSYVAGLPAGAPNPFFWFDCLSIDEHATQTLPQEWWSTTFQDAIRGIGRTLMVLAPWNDPVPLRRAWCLWELFSTHAVGAHFDVCLGPAERRAFEEALLEDSGVVFGAFAHIDVKNAEAGSAADQAMILGAVDRAGGCTVFNGLAFEQMRKWMKNEVDHIILARSADGILVQNKHTLVEVGKLVDLLTALDARDEAKRVCDAVVMGLTSLLGEAHEQVLAARVQQAQLLYQSGELHAAREAYTKVIAESTGASSEMHLNTYKAKAGLGLVIKELLQIIFAADFGGPTASHDDESISLKREAQQLLEAAIRGISDMGDAADAIELFKMRANLAELHRLTHNYDDATTMYNSLLEESKRLHGPSHVKTFMVMANMAELYRDSGDCIKAAEAIECSARGFTEQLGPTDTRTLQVKGNWAGLLAQCGNYQKALPVAREVVEGLHATIGKDHPMAHCPSKLDSYEGALVGTGDLWNPDLWTAFADSQCCGPAFQPAAL
jgi:tetratricopeptide (TPR) repeat protein